MDVDRVTKISIGEDLRGDISCVQMDSKEMHKMPEYLLLLTSLSKSAWLR